MIGGGNLSRDYERPKSSTLLKRIIQSHALSRASHPTRVAQAMAEEEEEVFPSACREDSPESH